VSIALTMFLLCAAGPATGAGSTSASATSSAVPSVERVVLEVDHTALLERQVADAAEDSAFFVRQDATRALTERHGVRVVERSGDPDAPAIVVKLAWKDYDGSVYRIEIATRRPGEQAAIAEVIEARCIDSTALTKAVLGGLPAALQQLEAPREGKAVPVGTGAGDGSGGEPAGTTIDPPVVEPEANERAPVLGPKGKAGVGLLAAGVAGLVAGGIVLAQGVRLDENENGGRYRPQVDFVPAGTTTMVVGGAAAVTGLVLLIVDRAGRQRAGSAATSKARVWPTSRGLLLTGRF
jgi:hypothetical protein